MTEVKIGIGTISYTDEELKKELYDLWFLRDAFLVLLNEKVTKDSDLPFRKKEVLEYAKEMYEENTSYSKDFIEECFDI